MPVNNFQNFTISTSTRAHRKSVQEVNAGNRFRSKCFNFNLSPRRSFISRKKCRINSSEKLKQLLARCKITDIIVLHRRKIIKPVLLVKKYVHL